MCRASRRYASTSRTAARPTRYPGPQRAWPCQALRGANHHCRAREFGSGRALDSGWQAINDGSFYATSHSTPASFGRLRRIRQIRELQQPPLVLSDQSEWQAVTFDADADLENLTAGAARPACRCRVIPALSRPFPVPRATTGGERFGACSRQPVRSADRSTAGSDSAARSTCICPATRRFCAGTPAFCPWICEA